MVVYSPYRSLARVHKEVVGDSFFLFPLGWGAASEANILEEELRKEGISVVRYDFVVNDVGSSDGYRHVENRLEEVAYDLNHGVARIIKPTGYDVIEIPPVSFDLQRPMVPLEDYVRRTGLGLVGGIEFCYRLKPLVNGGMIHPSTINRDIEMRMPADSNPEMLKNVGDVLHPDYLVRLPHITPLRQRVVRV
ncbi:MAG: hypothetical protein HYT70_01045 [Candidatus Aenigmarchaeota archaeon]|nr:hypothetical protein [Candidatus Aenigmarchaeota archaeon]